jgi:hypothetical protein
MQIVLRKGFGIKGGDLFTSLYEDEKQLRVFTVSQFRQVFKKTANSSLQRAFSDQFKKNEKGEPQNWMQMEENDIKVLFDRCKKQCVATIDQFRHIIIPDSLIVIK